MIRNTNVQNKRTYSLPEDVVTQFEKIVRPGQRSAVISQALREWLDQRQRKRLREEIIMGCREMADEYLALEKEFHPLEEEAGRAAFNAQKRGHRSRTPRSR